MEEINMNDPSFVIPGLRPESNKLTKEMGVIFIRMLNKTMREQQNVKPITESVFES
jgi:hypothetical protein